MLIHFQCTYCSFRGKWKLSEIFRAVGGKNSVSAEFSFKAFSAIMDPE